MYKLECKIINGLKNQSLSDITKITKEFIKNKQGSELFYKSIIERSIHLIPNEDALSISDYIKSFDNYASNKIYLRDMMIKSQPVLESHLDKLSFQDICSILFIFRSHHIGNTNFYRKINTKLMNSMPNEISQIDISKIANWLADPLRTQLYTETVYKQMADKITLSSELIKIFQGFVVADKADYEILNIVSKILVENVSYFKCDEISHALHLFSRSKWADKGLFLKLEDFLLEKGDFHHWVSGIQDMSYLGFVPEKIIKKCIKNLNNAQSLLELLIIEQALRRFELDIPDDLWHFRRVLFFQSPLKTTIKNIYLRYKLVRLYDTKIFNH